MCKPLYSERKQVNDLWGQKEKEQNAEGHEKTFRRG